MTLKNQHEVETTKAKLAQLGRLFVDTSADTTSEAYPKQLTLRSLRRSINQLKEEIVRYETRHGATTAN